MKATATEQTGTERPCIDSIKIVHELDTNPDFSDLTGGRKPAHYLAYGG